MSDASKVRSILENNIYCVVSTVNDDGSPWGSPVFFGFDDDVIYWRSWAESQHSKNLRQRPEAMVCVFDSHQPWGEGEGLYLHGRVEQLEDRAAVERALTVIDARSPESKQVDEFLRPNPRRIYRFVAVQAWINEDSTKDGKFIDIRREIKL